jgi:hypothetical protein
VDKPNGLHRDDPPAILLPVPIPEHALALQRTPDVVIEEARKAARALADVIEKKPKKVVINGEIYLEFEDWQTLGRFYGVSAAAASTRYVEFGDVVGFEATAEALLLVNGATVRISSAEAMCLNDEWKWQDKPLFQLKSMAQTRACAKALRNVLAWIVVLAGYKPTPAEELDGEKPKEVATPRRKSVQSVSTPPSDAARAVNDTRPDTRPISDAQHNRLWAIARESTVLKTEVRELVQHFGFEDTKDITRDKYQMICARLFELGKE